jgi:hypothetical protein
MKKVTLEFESLKALIDFTLLIELTYCKIDEANYRLTCELQEPEIELAKEGFNATILMDQAG